MRPWSFSPRSFCQKNLLGFVIFATGCLVLIFFELAFSKPARMLFREPRRGHASRRGFIRERLIPPTTIVGPSPAVIPTVIGPIAIAVIWPSIAVVATAIVIGFLNGCVA